MIADYGRHQMNFIESNAPKFFFLIFASCGNMADIVFIQAVFLCQLGCQRLLQHGDTEFFFTVNSNVHKQHLNIAQTGYDELLIDVQCPGLCYHICVVVVQTLPGFVRKHKWVFTDYITCQSKYCIGIYTKYIRFSYSLTIG